MFARLSALFVLAFVISGCTTTRVMTITAKPPDATIRVDGIERGKPPVTETIIFKGDQDIHTVTVSRLGYKEERKQLTKDFPGDNLHVELGFLTRRIAINVAPVAANISVDGKPITTEPVETTSIELPFTVDARNNWTTHTIVAEREGWAPVTKTASWQDNDQTYTLRLEPRKKDLTITTTPPGAQLYIDDQPVGTSPAIVNGHAFPVDIESGNVIPQTLRASKKGYPEVSVKIGWDEGQSSYSIPLIPRTKAARITTDPSGGAVTLDGRELPRDKSGVSVAEGLTFPPVDEQTGELKTYTAIASKKTEESEWYPEKLVIGWDDGKTDYGAKLREILTRPVALLTWNLERGDSGWEVAPKMVRDTLAWKDVSEGPQKDPPIRLTQFPRGTQIDTLAVSPDGANLLFTVLTGTDRNTFRSQILAIRTDGTQGASYLSDGKSLEITPSYSPSGDKIIFSSNRAGRRLSVWDMSAIGQPGIRQLTTGDTNDLWPSYDSDPKQRLYYQASVDTRPDPRIYMTQVGTTTRTDLTMMGGSQPRISPKNDQVVFCSINDKTGKRDIYTMSDRGGTPQNLTNTPDVDEFDPAWNKDGTRLAFVSDAGVDEERRSNYDVWVIDVNRPDRPIQVTRNGSWDDHPAWDPAGTSIYFRSNRGGDWNIWKVATR